MIPCNLHEKTNSDWLKTDLVNILSNQRVCLLEFFFVQITQNHKKLIQNPCIKRKTHKDTRYLSVNIWRVRKAVIPNKSAHLNVSDPVRVFKPLGIT